MNTIWRTTSVAKSSYLRGRIGWQGLRASEFIAEGPYLVTGTDFNSGSIKWDTCYHVTEKRYAEADYIHLKNQDILITKDGTIGKIAILKECPEKAVLNSGIFLLRCRDNSYKHEFIFHLLNSYLFSKFLDDNLSGSTIQHLYQYVFERFEFPIPPIEEQDKIAIALSTVDRAIEQTEAIIAKQQRIKTGLMQDLLTKGIDEHGNIRSEETHEFKDSSLGRIPIDWDIFPLDKATDVLDPNPSHRNPIYIEHGYPFISTVEFIEPDKVEINTPRRVAVETVIEQEKRCRFQEGSIAFSRKGTIGKTRILPSNLRFALLDSLCVINVKEGIESIFVNQILRSQLLTQQIESATMGVALPQMSIGRVRKLLIPIPKDREEQVNISNKISYLAFLEKQLWNTQQKLLSQKNGLMQDLLTGKVPVTPLLEATESQP